MDRQCEICGRQFRLTGRFILDDLGWQSEVCSQRCIDNYWGDLLGTNDFVLVKAVPRSKTKRVRACA